MYENKEASESIEGKCLLLGRAPSRQEPEASPWGERVSCSITSP